MDLTACFPASVARSCPLTYTVPLVGCTMPARMRMKVVFPAPFGPNKPNMPELIFKSTPFNALTALGPTPKVFRSPVISIMIKSFYLQFDKGVNVSGLPVEQAPGNKQEHDGKCIE